MQIDNTPYARDHGLQKKIRLGRRLFRIEENTRYYSDEDYKRAEKQFLKCCILEERCALTY